MTYNPQLLLALDVFADGLGTAADIVRGEDAITDPTELRKIADAVDEPPVNVFERGYSRGLRTLADVIEDDLLSVPVWTFNGARARAKREEAKK